MSLSTIWKLRSRECVQYEFQTIDLLHESWWISTFHHRLLTPQSFRHIKCWKPGWRQAIVLLCLRWKTSDFHHKALIWEVLTLVISVDDCSWSEKDRKLTQLNMIPLSSRVQVHFWLKSYHKSGKDHCLLQDRLFHNAHHMLHISFFLASWLISPFPSATHTVCRTFLWMWCWLSWKQCTALVSQHKDSDCHFISSPLVLSWDCVDVYCG